MKDKRTHSTLSLHIGHMSASDNIIKLQLAAHNLVRVCPCIIARVCTFVCLHVHVVSLCCLLSRHTTWHAVNMLSSAHKQHCKQSVDNWFLPNIRTLYYFHVIRFSLYRRPKRHLRTRSNGHPSSCPVSLQYSRASYYSNCKSIRVYVDCQTLSKAA